MSGLSLAVESGDYSLVSAHELLLAAASPVLERGLYGTRAQLSQRTGLAASCHVGSSQTRDGTHMPCTGRWILSRSTTREV